jgi:excisionase family DNA binding protein
MEYIGTTKAAEVLGISTGRIRQLILAGRLKAEKIGQTWLIQPHELDGLRDRKPGRPRHKGKGRVLKA